MQVDDQRMNPDDTVDVTEGIGGEGEEAQPCSRLPVSNVADPQRNWRTRVDPVASLIVVWAVS